MWVQGKFTAAGGLSRKVAITARAAELLIYDEKKVNVLERWPFSSLHQTSGSSGEVILEWPPDKARLVIADSKSLYKLRWSRQLPVHSHSSPVIVGLKWVVLGSLCSYLLVIGIPFISNLLPWSVEKSIFQTLQPGDSTSYCDKKQRANAALTKLIGRIYPLDPEDKEIPILVKVVSDPVVNAYAFPGARIFINSGLLKQAESSEELAGILGHEIEHVHRRHIVQTLLRNSLWLVFYNIIFTDPSAEMSELIMELTNASFSRVQEEEADRGAIRRLKLAEVDLEPMADFFKRMAKESIKPVLLSSHPSDEYRYKLIEGQNDGKHRAILTEDEWRELKSSCDSDLISR